MSNEMITQLPTVTNSMLSDIIYAVQGGVSVQETLDQVLSLNLSQVVLNYPGNPNSHLAGIVYQLCFDTTDNILYVCRQSGSTSTAVWVKAITLTAGTGITIVQNGSNIAISANGGGVTWTNVSGTTQTMLTDQGYIANNAGLVTLTLPTVASVGDALYIVGEGSGGFIIAQNASQSISIGAATSTAGVGGSVASTNARDSMQLVCVIANTKWNTVGGPQGNLTIV